MSVMVDQQGTVPPALSRMWPAVDRPLTVDDLLRQPDDGNRYELADGVLEVTPAPLTDHQRVVSRLQVILGVACPAEFEVLTGPGINLARDLHRIPDVAVVRPAPAGRGFLTRPPLLAVEVASRSTRKVDRTKKKAEYAAFGIDRYWIVVPDKGRPSLTAYRLDGHEYQQVAVVAGDARFAAEWPIPVDIVPSLLVADGKEWRSLLQ